MESVSNEDLPSLSTMEYHLAAKRMEVLLHATTWMSLENTNVKNQTQKGKFCIVLLE